MTAFISELEKPITAQTGGSISSYDIQKVRADFPILTQKVHGKPLVYLDNANTTQKPQLVIDTLTRYYSESNANVHRASHTLGERATVAYEGARGKIQRFLNAAHEEEIIYTRSATESINLVAQTYGRKNIGEGDEIIISAMEHHANIVPWQMLCTEKGAKLRVIPINDDGELLMDEYAKMLNSRTKFVGITQMSNALGTVNPVAEIIELAHAQGVPVLVDGAQSAYHRQIDVRALDCDFFVFSGHKLYGPTGIGILYGKRELLDDMPPWQGGGDMIRTVTFEKTVYADPPYRFEAGTPHIAGGIGLGAAVDYLTGLGMDNIAAYEHELMMYGTNALMAIPGLRMIGTAREKASVYSFVLENIHPNDVGEVLDREGVAVRIGQHCAHPVLARFGIPATIRASLGCYNMREDIDVLVRALHKAIKLVG